MQKGFTIIEMLVATAIFAIVMTLALSSLLNINDILSRAEAFRESNDNFSFALEVMMRDIRTGSNYDNSGDSGTLEIYNPAQGKNITYRLKSKTIERCDKGAGNCTSDNDFLQLTAPEAVVENMRFFVNGEESGDKIQPSVTIIINGHTRGKEKLRAYFNLQTTVSQRKLQS